MSIWRTTQAAPVILTAGLLAGCAGGYQAGPVAPPPSYYRPPYQPTVYAMPVPAYRPPPRYYTEPEAVTFTAPQPQAAPRDEPVRQQAPVPPHREPAPLPASSAEPRVILRDDCIGAWRLCHAYQ
jgi:hypothetical protein